MADRTTAVIVDDEFVIADYMEMICEDLGIAVLGKAHSAEEAERVIIDTAPDYVLMDVRLGGTRDGVDVANTVNARHPDTRVIYITGSAEPSTMARIMTDHPHRVLIKPVSEPDLREAFAA